MIDLIRQFHFLRPYWLWAVIPTLALWWQLYRERDPRLGLSDDIAPHLLEQLVARPAERPRIRPIILILPLSLVAILALSGPSFRRQPAPFAEDKSQLMLVVKVTPSMLTDDVQPSRLECVRTKIHDLLHKRGGAATGLIAYAGSAHLVMPATRDGDVIEHMLESLDPQIMPVDGDALVSALKLAAQQIVGTDTPGSILIAADSVEQADLNAFKTWHAEQRITSQFLVPLRDDAALQRSGVPAAAEAISATVQRISADNRDVDAIASRADRAIAALTADESTQWRDDGYLFVPILLLGVLYWCRRGWSINFD